MQWRIDFLNNVSLFHQMKYLFTERKTANLLFYEQIRNRKTTTGRRITPSIEKVSSSRLDFPIITLCYINLVSRSDLYGQ